MFRYTFSAFAKVETFCSFRNLFSRLLNSFATIVSLWAKKRSFLVAAEKLSFSEFAHSCWMLNLREKWINSDFSALWSARRLAYNFCTTRVKSFETCRWFLWTLQSVSRFSRLSTRSNITDEPSYYLSGFSQLLIVAFCQDSEFLMNFVTGEIVKRKWKTFLSFLGLQHLCNFTFFYTVRLRTLSRQLNPVEQSNFFPTFSSHSSALHTRE